MLKEGKRFYLGIVSPSDMSPLVDLSARPVLFLMKHLYGCYGSLTTPVHAPDRSARVFPAESGMSKLLSRKGGLFLVQVFGLERKKTLRQD